MTLVLIGSLGLILGGWLTFKNRGLPLGASENNGDGTYFQLETSLRVEPFPACLEWLPASIYTHDGSMYGLFSSNLVIFVQGFMIGQYTNSHGLARGIYIYIQWFQRFCMFTPDFLGVSFMDPF